MDRLAIVLGRLRLVFGRHRAGLEMIDHRFPGFVCRIDVRSGGDGTKVDMKNIKASLLNIVAEYDHLVSKSQSENIMGLISSEDQELVIIPSTHVGIMVSKSARYKLWPQVANWLSERSN